MRIISYNILTGGEGRADPIAEVLQVQQADLIALIEADDAYVLDRISRRLKMDVIHAPGNHRSVALLSKFPITDTLNLAPLSPGLTNCFLRATVMTPTGPLNLGIVHLHPRAAVSDEKIRLQELAIILDTFAAHRAQATPHILLGDFNANSPLQQINPDLCKPSTREQYLSNGRFIPRDVITQLIAAGYIDTFAAAAPDAAATQGTFTTQFPGQRVDFIFTHSIDPARIKKAWIETDRLAQFASDHFPVGTQID